MNYSVSVCATPTATKHATVATAHTERCRHTVVHTTGNSYLLARGQHAVATCSVRQRHQVRVSCAVVPVLCRHVVATRHCTLEDTHRRTVDHISNCKRRADLRSRSLGTQLTATHLSPRQTNDDIGFVFSLRFIRIRVRVPLAGLFCRGFPSSLGLHCPRRLGDMVHPHDIMVANFTQWPVGWEETEYCAVVHVADQQLRNRQSRRRLSAHRHTPFHQSNLIPPPVIHYAASDAPARACAIQRHITTA